MWDGERESAGLVRHCRELEGILSDFPRAPVLPFGTAPPTFPMTCDEGRFGWVDGSRQRLDCVAGTR